MSESSAPATVRYKRFPTWAIAVAILTLLSLVLIATNLLYASFAGQDIVLDGDNGELLYVAAFSGFTDEWELYDGQQSAKIVDEQLELRVNAPQTATWSSARHRFEDFDARVTAIASEGPIDNAFGVVFRVQDQADGDCDLPAVILCGIEQLLPLAGAAIRQALNVTASNDYLAFLISSDGYYSLWKSENGSTKLLSAWMSSPRINQGMDVANTIRVLARDSAYSFFINRTQVELCIPDDLAAASTYAGGECVDGAMQDMYRDESLSNGKIGVIAQSTATGGPGVVLRFDNMIVFSPADPADEDAKA